MTSSIQDKMEDIRNFVNISWKHYMLRQNKAQFHQLISALDTIEDAEAAILAFENDEIVESTGILYLVTYGILQAFFVQQDATQNLCEALKVPNTFSSYPQLMVIREIRNDSIGHPTKSDRPKSQPTSYHQISRISMSRQGFDLLSYDETGNRQFRKISLTSLLLD